MAPMKPMDPDFWRHKSLTEMTPQEWEALCDRCAKCCLHKLEDADTRAIYFTNVHCKLLDTRSCLCTDYPNRHQRVSDCVAITPEALADPYWLPATCAYRLLAEGKPLPDWHPLVSGDPHSVAASGNDLSGGRFVSEEEAGPLDHHLIDGWN